MSSQGKPLIKIGSYRFCIKAADGVKIRWRCSTHNAKGCSAVIHTIDNEMVKIFNVHNH